MSHIPQPSGSGLRYRYYDYSGPAWDSLSKHDLGQLTPTSTGFTDSFCLGFQDRPNCFAIRYNGAIRIDSTGFFTFLIYSDAGSKLYIDGYCAVNNDGPHAYSTYTSDSIYLDKGVYPITLDYFEDLPASGLTVYYQGPGVTKKKVPKSVLYYDPNSAVRLPVSGWKPLSAGVRITRLPNNMVSISVPYSNPYEMRIMRADGKVLKTIQGKTPAAYNFTRQDFKAGIYL